VTKERLYHGAPWLMFHLMRSSCFAVLNGHIEKAIYLSMVDISRATVANSRDAAPHSQVQLPQHGILASWEDL
jgi:hypothetical protein